MKPLTHILICIMMILVTACMPWRVEYLQQVEGKATQDQIAQRLG
jgi:hypothetical protein